MESELFMAQRCREQDHGNRGQKNDAVEDRERKMLDPGHGAEGTSGDNGGPDQVEFDGGRDKAFQSAPYKNPDRADDEADQASDHQGCGHGIGLGQDFIDRVGITETAIGDDRNQDGLGRKGEGFEHYGLGF